MQIGSKYKNCYGVVFTITNIVSYTRWSIHNICLTTEGIEYVDSISFWVSEEELEKDYIKVD